MKNKLNIVLSFAIAALAGFPASAATITTTLSRGASILTGNYYGSGASQSNWQIGAPTQPGGISAIKESYGGASGSNYKWCFVRFTASDSATASSASFSVKRSSLSTINTYNITAVDPLRLKVNSGSTANMGSKSSYAYQTGGGASGVATIAATTSGTSRYFAITPGNTPGEAICWATNKVSSSKANYYAYKVYVYEEATTMAQTVCKDAGKELSFTAKKAGAWGAKSSDPSVATVTVGGSDLTAKPVVTGVTEGTANITVSNMYYQTTFQVTVVKPTVEVTPASGTYNGAVQTPTITVKVGGTALKAGTDYAVTTSAGEVRNAGTYDYQIVGQGSYSGFTAAATFTIAPRAVTVTANGAEKTYGADDPALTATVSETLGGDTVAYALKRKTGEDVGDYDITPSGDENQGNYAVTFAKGKLTIKPKAVTVKVRNAMLAYGDAEPTTFAADIDGTNGTDGASIAYTATVSRTADDGVGEYDIVAGGEAAQGNYAVTSFTGAKLTVKPRRIRVSVDAAEKSYGEPDPENYTYRVRDWVTGTDRLPDGRQIVLVGALARTAGEDVRDSPFDIDGGTLTEANNPNYVFEDDLDGEDRFTIKPVECPFGPGEEPGEKPEGNVSVFDVKATYSGNGVSLDLDAIGNVWSEALGCAVTVTCDATPTEAGEHDVTYVVEAPCLAAPVSRQARITVLARTGVVVRVTGNCATNDYDGEEHAVEGFTLASNDPLYDVTNVLFTGVGSTNGTDAGKYPMGLSAADFANTNANFKDVRFDVTDGELVIEHVPYSVVYDPNGGIGMAATSNAILNVGFPVGPNIFTRTGYTFRNWTNATGTVYAPGATVTNLTATAGATVTLYATWEANAYDLVYAAGNGTDESVTTNLTYDVEHIVLGNPFKKVGCSFVSWTNAEGVAYQPGQAVTNLTAEDGATVTWTAAWTANVYTVTFDSAGGSAVEPIVADFGAKISAPTAPTRKGYTFGGWYDCDEPYEFATMPARDVVLTAHWTEDPYEVEPGKPVSVEAATADEAIAKTEIVIADSAAEAAGQKAVVKQVARQLSDGKWEVSLAIDETAVGYVDPAKAVPELAEGLATVATTGKGEVEIAAENLTPGLYYSVVGVTDLGDFGNADKVVEGPRVLADGKGGITLEFPDMESAPSAFFKIRGALTK